MEPEYFITFFTVACTWLLPSDRWIQFTFSHPVPLISALILSCLPVCSALPRGRLHLGMHFPSPPCCCLQFPSIWSVIWRVHTVRLLVTHFSAHRTFPVSLPQCFHQQFVLSPYLPFRLPICARDSRTLIFPVESSDFGKSYRLFLWIFRNAFQVRKYYKTEI